jgi:hypothetical protein
VPDALFVDAEELAKVLPVSAYWLKAQARRTDPDALPSYRGGKRVVFLEAQAVEWFMRTQRRTPVPSLPRRRRVPVAARRRASGKRPEGRTAGNAHRTRVSAFGPPAVALEVPQHEP